MREEYHIVIIHGIPTMHKGEFGQFINIIFMFAWVYVNLFINAL